MADHGTNDIIVIVEALVLLICSGYFLYWGILKRFEGKLNEVPFGYKGIPGIGFLVEFKGPNCQRKLIEMKNQYGKICKVRMGSYDCVWLNDYKLIKEAWNSNGFCGRPDIPGINLRTKGFKGGIIFNDGKDFTDQRRFVVHHLKNLGMGKSSIEHSILHEISDVISTIEKQAGKPISTRHLFSIASFNIIWRMITGGSRFAHDDPLMSLLVETLNRNMELNEGARAAFFMPWLSKYFPTFIGWKKYIEDANYIFDFWVKFAENRQVFGVSDNNDGFLKSYLTKIAECEDPDSSFYNSKGLLSLATVLQDLFIAGTETTAVTLQWTFLYLAAFPSCQEKVAKEVMMNLGYEKVHEMKIKARFPYTEAFIREVLRFSTLAPLGMLHSTTEDVNFHGYFIPKDTIVVTNVSSVHYDESYWNKPYEFAPERFLSKDMNNNVLNTEGFIPFSIGKRSCPGMELAKQTLFLTLVAVIQKFQIRPSSDDTQLRPKIGVSAIPFPHKLIFHKRVK